MIRSKKRWQTIFVSFTMMLLSTELPARQEIKNPVYVNPDIFEKEVQDFSTQTDAVIQGLATFSKKEIQDWHTWLEKHHYYSPTRIDLLRRTFERAVKAQKKRARKKTVTFAEKSEVITIKTAQEDFESGANVIKAGLAALESTIDQAADAKKRLGAGAIADFIASARLEEQELSRQFDALTTSSKAQEKQKKKLAVQFAKLQRKLEKLSAAAERAAR